MKLIAVYTTVGNLPDARLLCAALVEQRLVACAQMSEIHSIYRWNGALQDDQEVRVLLKTTHDRYAQLQEAIRELHPYQLPAIYATPVEQAFAPYAEWVAESVGAMPSNDP